jgi:hypothetical protein
MPAATAKAGSQKIAASSARKLRSPPPTSLIVVMLACLVAGLVLTGSILDFAVRNDIVLFKPVGQSDGEKS